MDNEETQSNQAQQHSAAPLIAPLAPLNRNRNSLFPTNGMFSNSVPDPFVDAATASVGDKRSGDDESIAESQKRLCSIYQIDPLVEEAPTVHAPPRPKKKETAPKDIAEEIGVWECGAKKVKLTQPDGSNERIVYQCETGNCKKNFDTETRYSRHKMSHSMDRPFECEFDGCRKAYTRREHLKRHIRSHTGERPFPCEVPGCSKAFTTAYKMKRHMKTHVK